MTSRATLRSSIFTLAIMGIFSPAHALTQQELIAKLESAGFSQIRDVKTTAEGTTVKAMKDGREVSLVVDSTGQFQERQGMGSNPPPNVAQTTPVQPDRTPQQSDRMRDQDRRAAEDVQVGRDWRTTERDGDRMDHRRMGRMDDDDWDNRMVSRNRQMQRDEGRSYYDDERPRVRLKICTEYANGDEYCHYRN